MRTMRWRAEVNKHYGVESEVGLRDWREAGFPRSTCRAAAMRPSRGPVPRPGAIGATTRWRGGYTRAAPASAASQIHQQTQVTGIDVRAVRARGTHHRGTIETGNPECRSPVHARVHGHGRPAHADRRASAAAMVSEPMKPWLDPILVSGSLHVYVSQTARAASW